MKEPRQIVVPLSFQVTTDEFGKVGRVCGQAALTFPSPRDRFVDGYEKRAPLSHVCSLARLGRSGRSGPWRKPPQRVRNLSKLRNRQCGTIAAGNREGGHPRC